jgi:hypothetical protein
VTSEENISSSETEFYAAHETKDAGEICIGKRNPPETSLTTAEWRRQQGSLISFHAFLRRRIDAQCTIYSMGVYILTSSAVSDGAHPGVVSAGKVPRLLRMVAADDRPVAVSVDPGAPRWLHVRASSGCSIGEKRETE